MIDLKQAAIELGQEKAILTTKIQALINEFENKTGFAVQEIITSEVGGYGGKVLRLYSVKLSLA